MTEKSEKIDQNFITEIKANNNLGINILLIEDIPGDARLIQEMIKELQNTTIKLEIQSRLAGGLQFLNQNKFHVILLDLSLPDSNGLETIERMLVEVSDIPIIILTGTDDKVLAIEAVKIGAQDYLIKGSFDKQLLERSIFYSIERQKIKERLKKTEEKYHKAFLQTDFYKDIFIHDMGNILQGIISGIQLCGLDIINPEDKKNVEVASDIIEKYVKRGAKLISNIRKLSQLEDFEVPLQSIELCSPLKKSIISLKNAYQTRKINVQIDSHRKKFFVLANCLLPDVFENILINAVRHNQNSQVEIFIRISQEKNNLNEISSIKMEFIDNGLGITDSRKKTIFQRGSKEDKNQIGMGLGLSLVSKIIKNIGGKIWVENRVEGDYTKGSNFAILIPEAI